MPKKNPIEGACDHEDKHYIAPDGSKGGLFCELPKDHTGDHEADYPQGDLTVRGFWSDAAGVPVEQVPVIPIPRPQ